MINLNQFLKISRPSRLIKEMSINLNIDTKSLNSLEDILTSIESMSKSSLPVYNLANSHSVKIIARMSSKKMKKCVIGSSM